jgi:hypothetical protein
MVMIFVGWVGLSVGFVLGAFWVWAIGRSKRTDAVRRESPPADRLRPADHLSLA